MSEENPPARPAGRARLDRAVGKAPLPHHAVTAIIRNGRRAPTPVFVDPSGARRRRVRLIVSLIGLLILAALLALWLSQFLGTAQPPAAR